MSSNFYLSTNMNLPVPTVGQDPGPDYASNINAALTLVDSHNHSSGQGVQINPSGLNINADLPININNIISARSLRFSPQISPIGGAADLGCVYESGVDLYYNDGNGNQVRITQSGGVAGSPGSIANLTSPASATYVSANQTFVWQSAASTPANLDAGSVIFRNITASSNGITISAPIALASSYSLTLPGLPASQKFMTLDASGNISAPWAVDNSSLEVSSNNVQVKALGITQAMKAIRATGSTVGLGGVAISSSCGIFSTTSNTPVAVTNLSVTITTGGNPVKMFLISDGTGSVLTVAGSTIDPIFANFFFYQGAGAISQTQIGVQYGATGTHSIENPTTAMQTMDFPAAGTYTYTFRAASGSNTFTTTCTNAKLVAYEL